MVKCMDCGSSKLHEFQVRSDYGSFHPVNSEVAYMEAFDRPYYVTGYYCEDCEEAVSVTDK